MQFLLQVVYNIYYNRTKYSSIIYYTIHIFIYQPLEFHPMDQPPKRRGYLFIAFVLLNTVIYGILLGTAAWVGLTMYQNQDASGIYFPDIDVVIIKPERVEENFPLRWQTAKHEMSHAYFYTILNQTQRDLWTNISDSSTEYISNYASTNADEDFAESMSWSITCSMNPSMIEMLTPQKKQFFYDHIYWSDIR